MSVERINAAVRECLDNCYASQNPLACWSEFMKNLWADDTWSKGDVEQVHLATRRILQALLVGDSGEVADKASECADGVRGSSDPSAGGGA